MTSRTLFVILALSGLLIAITPATDPSGNPKSQRPNPGTEVGHDFLSKPKQPEANGYTGYRKWAIDLTGAEEHSGKNPHLVQPMPKTRPVDDDNKRTSTNSASRVEQHTVSGSSTTARPRHHAPGIPMQSPKQEFLASSSSLSREGSGVPKSWAEIAKSNTQPESPTPTVNIPAKSTVVGTAITERIDRRGAYSENPRYSKGDSVTDEDLEKLSEALFLKDKNNAWKHITLNLQKRTSSDSPIDQAPQPLLTVNSAAFDIETIRKVQSIYDNYRLDTRSSESLSSNQRAEETDLVNNFLSQNVTAAAMRFLADKHFVAKNFDEYQHLLRRVWFDLYSRGSARRSSSGFEHVFLAELKEGAEVIGLHNWLYFNAEETKGHANYLGYIKKLDLGDKAAILKLHAKFNGIDKPVTTMFIGTSPELEMALYTVCFMVRPGPNGCPVSLGGAKFKIIAHKILGKKSIASAYPQI